MNRNAISKSARLLVTAVLTSVVAVLALPLPTVAETPPPPSFTINLSPDNVVPGPGQPGSQDPNESVNETSNPGELCWSAAVFFIDSPTSIGIYQGGAGSNGPLAIDFPVNSFTSCAENVDQATLDALAADASDYYFQVDSNSFPNGASRSQLTLQQPTVWAFVSTFVCQPGTKFPTDIYAPTPKSCGDVSRFDNGVVNPMPGYTTTHIAGVFPIDYLFQGIGGFSATLDPNDEGGFGCIEDNGVCAVGPIAYSVPVPVGPITVRPISRPAGAKLAYTNLVVDGETGVNWSRGPEGSLKVDMTGRYSGVVNIAYYYTAPAHLTPPIEIAPTVDLATGTVSADGGIPLTLTFGATERGSEKLHYEIQASTDGHKFDAVAETTKPTATVREPGGHKYVFRVRATDSDGAVSAWAAAAPVSLDVIQDTSPLVSYVSQPQAPWVTTKSHSAFGGTTTAANGNESLGALASLTVPVNGSEVAVVMLEQPGAGDAMFAPSDDLGAQVPLSAATQLPRDIVYTHTFAGDTGNSLSLQAGGQGPVAVDAIIVLR